MSYWGKLSRGMDYYYTRDIDGILDEGIMKDPNKMKDVNFFKAYLEGKDNKTVRETIMQMVNVSKKPDGRNSAIYFELKDKLKNWVVAAPVKIKSKGKK